MTYFHRCSCWCKFLKIWGFLKWRQLDEFSIIPTLSNKKTGWQLLTLVLKVCFYQTKMNAAVWIINLKPVFWYQTTPYSNIKKRYDQWKWIYSVTSRGYRKKMSIVRELLEKKPFLSTQCSYLLMKACSWEMKVQSETFFKWLWSISNTNSQVRSLRCSFFFVCLIDDS